MKRFIPVGIAAVIIGVSIVFGMFNRTPAPNPDPNHTHADFAVWVNGTQLDFSDASYMSGLSTDESTHDEESEVHHPYLHLHDGIGHVIHRHKPGLNLSEFMNSIGFEFRPDLGTDKHCIVLPDNRSICNEPDNPTNVWRLFINSAPFSIENDTQMFGGIMNYVFEDGDALLITYGADPPAIQKQLEMLSDDACLYSRTCPWRGDPPAENCIADPAVPCVVVE